MRGDPVARGLAGAALVGLALVIGGATKAPPPALVQPSLAVNATPRDTARDSLLVSDDVYQGWKWFHVYCYRCHGTDAFGGQLAPDLRQAVAPGGGVTHDVFMQTVTDGRVSKGMPSWKALLDSSQIEQLYAYVKARSDGSLAPGRPHRASDLRK